ncbi:MAG: hypothetical protein ACIAXF_01960 [Phycisphaerales bacterium JB063]
MPGFRCCFRVWLALAVLLGVVVCFAPAAQAQQSGVELKPISRPVTGLGGLVRRGTWTPIRLDLFNESVEVRSVICRWLLTDDDGDDVIAQRAIDLTPQRDQQVWLYANPPLNENASPTWTFQVVDADSGDLLAQQTASMATGAYLSPTVGVVGVCGVEDMGLSPYQKWVSAHEQTIIALGLNLETLPDRWYGLSMLSTLVWGPNDSGDPASTAMSGATQQAVREWVFRGGHLVVVLPAVGQTWTTSALSDVLGPIGPGDMERIEAVPPFEVFRSLRAMSPMTMVAFDPPADSGYSEVFSVPVAAPVAEGETPGPEVDHTVAISRRYGFGQVTLVGIDLTDTKIFESVQGSDLHRVWTRLLGWRASKSGVLFTSSELEAFKNDLTHAERISNRFELGDWVDTRVAKQATAGPAIGLAVVLFIIYWAVALVSFPGLLRGKGWDRFSWLIFLGVVGIFTAVAWGGAALLRPARTSATHFTVLDIDGNNGNAHARSWVSLFVPRFDDIDVAVPSDRDAILPNDLINVVSSPGIGMSIEGAGYVDTQTYSFESARPDHLRVPIRATTKPFTIDFLGQIVAEREGLEQPFQMPRAKDLAIGPNDLPTGSVTHHFDEDLTDVLIIYCPGGTGQASDNSWKPIVWRYANASGGATWAPGDPMPMPTSIASGERLWAYPDQVSAERFWNSEGFLGRQFAGRRFRPGNNSDADLVYDISLLSFYDAMPPPLIDRDGGTGMIASNDFAVYQRAVLRGIDMTALTTGRRLIIIGHLRDSRCPTPFSVDGEAVPTEGWTVVRWIYDL